MSALMTQQLGGWFAASTAIVTADASIGKGASVWFGAVIRGDVAPITIGERTNVQDNAVVHCDRDEPNVIEDSVTIGHAAIVHGVFVGSGSLIGMNATLLGRSKIGRQCIVAAGAVVPPGADIPDRSVVMGVPGRVVRRVSDDDLSYITSLPERYVKMARRYAAGEFS